MTNQFEDESVEDLILDFAGGDVKALFAITQAVDQVRKMIDGDPGKWLAIREILGVVSGLFAVQFGPSITSKSPTPAHVVSSFATVLMLIDRAVDALKPSADAS